MENAMFKNRSIEMKVVKTPKQNDSYIRIPRPRLTPEQITEISKDTARTAAFLAGAGYTLKKVVDVASEIAIITAKAKIK